MILGDFRLLLFSHHRIYYPFALSHCLAIGIMQDCHTHLPPEDVMSVFKYII